MVRPRKSNLNYISVDTIPTDEEEAMVGVHGIAGAFFMDRLRRKIGHSDGLALDYSNPVTRGALANTTKTTPENMEAYLQTLADMNEIDPEAWVFGIIYSQKFVDRHASAFSKRESEIPTLRGTLIRFGRVSDTETPVSDAETVVSDTETHAHVDGNQGKERKRKRERERERETESNSIRSVEHDATRTDYDTEFEEFWKQYPSRDKYPNPKKPAKEAFIRKRKKGVKVETIIEGVRRYSEFVESDGMDPQFIAQAKTWLNQDRWTEGHEGTGKEGRGRAQHRTKYGPGDFGDRPGGQP